MMWAALMADGHSPLIFSNRGIKINAAYYRENVLKIVLKSWADKHFVRRPWTVQQDSAQSHIEHGNQEWLKKLYFYRTMATKIWGSQSVGLLRLGNFRE